MTIMKDFGHLKWHEYQSFDLKRLNFNIQINNDGKSLREI